MYIELFQSIMEKGVNIKPSIVLMTSAKMGGSALKILTLLNVFVFMDILEDDVHTFLVIIDHVQGMLFVITLTLQIQLDIITG